MNTYQYAPINLEGSTTRLLRLRKGTEPDIECELFEAWLDREDLIEYEALSYCWGGMELLEFVRIDGKVLQITRNLYWALRNLRSASIDRILWVDAICIDQADTDERRHQGVFSSCSSSHLAGRSNRRYQSFVSFAEENGTRIVQDSLSTSEL